MNTASSTGPSARGISSGRTIASVIADAAIAQNTTAHPAIITLPHMLIRPPEVVTVVTADPLILSLYHCYHCYHL